MQGGEPVPAIHLKVNNFLSFGPSRTRETPPALVVSVYNGFFVLLVTGFGFVITVLYLLSYFSVGGGPNFAIAPADPVIGYCSNATRILASEFMDRQRSLAQTLASLNASAYIAEPGANAAYFANLSGSSWHISERPLLLIVTAEATVPEPKISVLTPAFEATRAKLLAIPAAKAIDHPQWAEDTNPYSAAIRSISSIGRPGKIFVDPAMRHFVVDGLQRAAPDAQVSIAPLEVLRLRERKSAHEIALMKCANEATVLAIRSVRKRMHIGIHESQVQRLIQQTLTLAGLSGGFGLVLFGENAALPHGSGTDRRLGKNDFVLIDTGGSLHGYESDITRTFALPASDISARQLAIWRHVKNAQLAAHRAAHNGTITASVDAAARNLLTQVGYGRYFTHRLGHGIGLEGHEGPYLRGGSDDIILTGHAFSNEPGVYIEGELGVRLEDCFYIDKSGRPRLFTEAVGGFAQSPWEP